MVAGLVIAEHHVRGLLLITVKGLDGSGLVESVKVSIKTA
jgi:hypothetical protein